jgi:hypothetical protein
MNSLYTLSDPQLFLIQRPLDARIFLEGQAGCGKTTAAVERLLFLMEQGVPGGSILLLLPQRTLAQPYEEALRTPGVTAGSMVFPQTLGGLAQRMVDLFWPMVVEEAGFAHPNRPPTFLTLETAQYYMAHLARPLLDEGYFDSVTIERNRLYSQVIDNLNKAAVVGFPHTEIGERLKAAWVGEPGQVRVYDDAQACATRFRQYCLEHNLLDFSLQMEVFLQHLWPLPLCRNYLLRTYRHLIFDNAEEDTPVAHDLLGAWLLEFDSALIVYDHDAGYRSFLGADPLSAYALKELCTDQVFFDQSFVTPPALQRLGERMAQALETGGGRKESGDQDEGDEDGRALFAEYRRFYPQMLDWVAEQIARLTIEEGVPPGEIVVLAPFLSDALRFSLMNRLEGLGIPARSHRPSRSLRDEPVTHCLLTLAGLAHPTWGLSPSKYDVAFALVQAIEGMDLVRARLLTDIAYRTKQGALAPFDEMVAEKQERITYRLGNLFDTLRLWLAEYAQGQEAELDHFISRLFGEVLSQPGFGFHLDFAAGEVTANLVESAQKFRWAVGAALAEEGVPPGKEYLLMVQDGVIAAQYIRSWQTQVEDAVLLAPAYTFLMSNRPVQVQFWLDAGSRGWFERLYQPLTHPFVLSRGWSKGTPWTDEHEFRYSQEAMRRLALGLTRRCRGAVYLGLSELSEQGYENKGPLLRVIQRVVRESSGS